MPARRIVLFTSNPGKRQEYARTLGRYGIKPTFEEAPQGTRATQERAARLIAEGADLVIREEAGLRLPGSVEPMPGKPRHLQPVDNVSHATTWVPGTRPLEPVEHRHIESVPGYVDLETPAPEAGFGWDGTFRSAATGRTYAEDAALGLKTSARDLVFAQIVERHLHFDRQVDLAFSPTGQERLVDFARMPLDHMRDVPWLRTPAFLASPVARLLAAAVEGGIFYRSARSRRERNYWLPGLNGGVPLVPKKDEIHELTFRFHDLMHAVSPDLLPTGMPDAALRRVYILHRMVGEAVSLVMADHAFVDTLERSGCDYDFAKRRIHPLFASLDADAGTPEGLRAMARANMRYALLGDDAALRALGADPAALDAYASKYGRFFAEDYVWTDRNHAAMAGQAALMEKWARAAGPAIEAAGVATLEAFAERVADRMRAFPTDLDVVEAADLADAVFDQAWEDFVEPAMAHAPGLDAVDAVRARSNAFARWLLGQTVMYARYDHVPGIARMGALLHDRLARSAAEPFREAEIARLRGFHDRAVDTLETMRAISAEEARLFKEVVPVFDPNFVFYDAKVDGPPETLEEVARRILPRSDAPAAGPTP